MKILVILCSMLSLLLSLNAAAMEEKRTCDSIDPQINKIPDVKLEKALLYAIETINKIMNLNSELVLHNHKINSQGQFVIEFVRPGGFIPRRMWTLTFIETDEHVKGYEVINMEEGFCGERNGGIRVDW